MTIVSTSKTTLSHLYLRFVIRKHITFYVHVSNGGPIFSMDLKLMFAKSFQFTSLKRPLHPMCIKETHELKNFWYPENLKDLQT